MSLGQRPRFPRSGLRLLVLASLSLCPRVVAAESRWVEIERLLDRMEAGGAAAESAAPPAGKATGRGSRASRRTASDEPLLQALERTHAARRAEFDRVSARALPPKARARLEAARAAYEAGQGRLLALLREIAAAKSSAAEARAGFQEAREILGRLAEAERRQPLSGDLKMKAPPLRPPALAQGADLQAPETPAASAAATIGVVPPLLKNVAADFDSPLAVYSWARDRIAPEFYHGFMKGAEQTYLEGSGNDADTASLLVALLRAKGVPARYARATVTVPAERLRALAGTASVEQAVRVLERGGVPHEVVPGAGGISAVKMARVWAEAYVPYANYRGAPLDAQGKVWVPLDPGFKELAPPTGIDVVKEFGLDPDALADGYLAAVQAKMPFEFARQRVAAELAARGKTYEDAVNHRSPLVEDLGILPSTLPYAVEGRPEVSYETPPELRHTVHFRGERRRAGPLRCDARGGGRPRQAAHPVLRPGRSRGRRGRRELRGALEDAALPGRGEAGRQVGRDRRRGRRRRHRPGSPVRPEGRPRPSRRHGDDREPRARRQPHRFRSGWPRGRGPRGRGRPRRGPPVAGGHELSRPLEPLGRRAGRPLPRRSRPAHGVGLHGDVGLRGRIRGRGPPLPGDASSGRVSPSTPTCGRARPSASKERRRSGASCSSRGSRARSSRDACSRTRSAWRASPPWNRCSSRPPRASWCRTSIATTWRRTCPPFRWTPR